jgi:hypothetical protein
LAECGRAAANEKSARKPGREPETFHDSDELTNFATAAQQKVREGHYWKPETALPSFAKSLIGWAEMSQRFLLTACCGGG